jgi:hypothetical protein
LRDILTSERLLQRIEWGTITVLIILILGARVLYTTRMALGVLQGGAISILSFQVLKWQLRRAFQRSGKLPQKSGLLAGYYFRYLVTLFIVFVVMYYGWANPIAFVVGLSTVIISILVVGGYEFFVLLRNKGEG